MPVEHPAFRAFIEATKAHRRALAKSRAKPDVERLWQAVEAPREALNVARDDWEATGFLEVLS